MTGRQSDNENQPDAGSHKKHLVPARNVTMVDCSSGLKILAEI